MTYSMIIAALILVIAAFFGMKRQERITTLTTEWEELVEQGREYDIPEDPAADYAPTRVATRTERMERREMVDDFSAELIAFMKEMKEARKNGNGNDPEVQKRGMELIARMLDFSSDEVRLLVGTVLEDQSLDQETKRELVMMSIMMLSESQPETSLALILETKKDYFEDERMGDHFIGMAIGQLAKRDPLAALEWMNENKDEIGKVTDQMRRQILMSAASQDMGSALGMIDDLEFDQKKGVVGSLGQAVTKENVGDFVTAMRGLKDRDEARAGLGNIAGSVFGKDFKLMTTWMGESDLTAEERKAVLSGVNYHNTKGETGKWLTYLTTQEKGAESPVVSSLVQDWTRNDYRAAGEWVNTVEQGPARDRAALAYAQTLSRHEPEAAAVWAETLPAGKQRQDLMKDIHRQLSQRDPEAAAAFAQKHELGKH
ncbi:MAG: hypothetical protein ACSHYF_03655 [Verrucomicrobiaceae bacterium]